MTMHKDIFVYQANGLPKNDVFLGYAMREADIFIGTEGEQAYRDMHGPIPSDLDGEYHFLRHEKNDVLIGGDRNSLVPLYVYRNQGFWAVSNSFFELLKLATDRGDTLTIVPEVLEGWRGFNAFFQNTCTFQTCVAEIVLTPSYCDIVIDKKGPREQIRSRTKVTDYAAAISHFRELTFARVDTLVRAGMDVIIDLTGGLDSRAIFAAIFHGYGEKRFLALNKSGQIVVRTVENLKEDYAIVEPMAKTLGLHMTLDRIQAQSNDIGPDALSHLSAEESKKVTDADMVRYNKWRKGNLGRNGYIRPFPLNQLSTAFKSDGIFAGGHKSTYPGETNVRDGFNQLENVRSRFSSDAIFDMFKKRMIVDLERAQSEQGIELPFTSMLNREFVMRFHSNGRLGRKRLSPLGYGIILDATANLTGPELACFKGHHDIIASSSDFMFNYAYDNPKKAPQPDLVLTPLPEVPSLPPGKVYGKLPPKPVPSDNPDKAPAHSFPPELLRAAHRTALNATKNLKVQELLGKEYCMKMNVQLRKMVAGEPKPIEAHNRAKIHLFCLVRELVIRADKLIVPTGPMAQPKHSYIYRARAAVDEVLRRLQSS